MQDQKTHLKTQLYHPISKSALFTAMHDSPEYGQLSHRYVELNIKNTEQVKL